MKPQGATTNQDIPVQTSYTQSLYQGVWFDKSKKRNPEKFEHFVGKEMPKRL